MGQHPVTHDPRDPYDFRDPFDPWPIDPFPALGDVCRRIANSSARGLSHSKKEAKYLWREVPGGKCPFPVCIQTVPAKVVNCTLVSWQLETSLECTSRLVGSAVTRTSDYVTVWCPSWLSGGYRRYFVHLWSDSKRRDYLAAVCSYAAISVCFNPLKGRGVNRVTALTSRSNLHF